MKLPDAYDMKTEDQLEGQMTIFDFLPMPQKSTGADLPKDFMNPPEEEDDDNRLR